MVALERALGVLGRELASFERILDFGCGPGRVMRHLGPLAQSSQLHGVDVDPDSIAWCAEHIPFATFAVGPHEPPLPYAEGQFDLVYNHSVFTHIDERRQDLWLAELARVLAPGGIALLTVHSTRQWNQALGYFAEAGEDIDAYRGQLGRDGIMFISDDAYVGSPHPEWYHSTFHAPWYVHRHWARFFTIRPTSRRARTRRTWSSWSDRPHPTPCSSRSGLKALGARPPNRERGKAAGASSVRARVAGSADGYAASSRSRNSASRPWVGWTAASPLSSAPRRCSRAAQYQQAELTKIVERELRLEVERGERAGGQEGQ